VRPRAVDWALFVLVTFEMLSGLFSLLVGRPEGRLLFYLHAGGGLALMLLLFWKFRRVVHRVTNPRNWEPATIVSILTSIGLTQAESVRGANKLK
jgi:peptidoglycan/LPS O-acetylase OafA/YrhL